MKRFVLDALTVVALAALAVVVTFWARSYVLRDTIGSHHDLPPTPAGGLPGPNGGWRTRTIFSFPGRFEWVSVDVGVLERWHAPTTRPRSVRIVSGWWLFQRRSLDWRPSTVPPPPRLWGGFGAWGESRRVALDLPVSLYRETRDVRARGVGLPYWAPALAAGLLPLCRLYRATRSGRMGPLAYRLAVTASTLLLAGGAVAWARSHDVCHTLERTRTFNRPATTATPADFWARTLRLYSSRGAVSVFWQEQHPGGPGPWLAEGARYQFERGDPSRIVIRPGSSARVYLERGNYYLAIGRDERPGRDPAVLLHGLGLTVPYWVPLAAAAVLPFAHGWRAAKKRRRERRAIRGLCRRCGYDVRASGPRCSECGEPVPAADPAGPVRPAV